MWIKLTPFWAGPSALICFYYSQAMWREGRYYAAKTYFFAGCVALGAIAYYFFVDPTFKQFRDLIGF